MTTPARLETIRRDLRQPKGITDPADLRAWRVGYIAGLMDGGEATDAAVFAEIRSLPDAAGLLQSAKAWRDEGAREVEA